LLPGEAPGTSLTYKEMLERTVKTFANEAYRTLLITYKDMSMSDYNKIKLEYNNFEKEGDNGILEQNLTAIAIFGL
jgi:magnesium-transporting ATPase (P-type)